MKKSTIIAAAIASTIAGTAIADTSIYGNVRLSLRNQAELNMDSSKLIVGFKASEDLGNGMTGFARVELEHDDANAKGSGWDNDLSYVGLKGDFGSVSVGYQNDAAGFACSGTDLFTLNGGNACGVGAVNGGLNNAIVYLGGSDAFSFVLAATINGSQDQGGDNVIGGLKFAGESFSIGGQVTSLDEVSGDATVMVIGGTLMLGNVQLGLTFADNDTADMNTAYAVGLKMPLAGGTFKAAMDTGDALDAGVNGDGTAVNVEFNKGISKSMYWGASFTTIDNDGGAWADDQVAAWLGMKF